MATGAQGLAFEFLRQGGGCMNMDTGHSVLPWGTVKVGRAETP